MDFFEILDQVVDLLRRRGRITFRALQLQFQLDDESLEVWGVVEQGTPLTEPQIALFRLADMHAVAAGAQAVDLIYHAAGTSAIFTTNPLERFFRDIRVATQHRLGSPDELYQVG